MVETAVGIVNDAARFWTEMSIVEMLLGTPCIDNMLTGFSIGVTGGEAQSDLAPTGVAGGADDVASDVFERFILGAVLGMVDCEDTEKRRGSSKNEKRRRILLSWETRAFPSPSKERLLSNARLRAPNRVLVSNESIAERLIVNLNLREKKLVFRWKSTCITLSVGDVGDSG